MPGAPGKGQVHMGILGASEGGDDPRSDEECASTSSSLTLAACGPPLVATLRIAPPDLAHLAAHPRAPSATEPTGQFPFSPPEVLPALQSLYAERLDDEALDLPAGWSGLQSVLKLPAGERVLSATDGAVTLVERGRGSKALDDDALHFVATQSTIKKIFELPYSNESLTVAVRVGPGAEPGARTLILTAVVDQDRHRLLPSEHDRRPAQVDELDAAEGGRQRAEAQGADAAGAQPGGAARRKHRKRAPDAASKFLCYSVARPPDGERGVAGEDGTETFRSVEEGLELLDVEPGAADGGAVRWERRVQGAGMAGVLGQSEEGRLLRRAVQFRFKDLSLMLGSDTVIYNRGGAAPELSLRVEDADSEMTKLTCLDYWLDSTLNNVAQTAVCYHKEGKVHGYSMVRTEDLPSWREGVAFEPQAVMESASSVLSFLQSHCTKEAGTYWLYRPEGSDEVQLFCLSEDGGVGPLQQQGGMLCFKIARRLQQSDRAAAQAGRPARHRLRTARLLVNALSTPPPSLPYKVDTSRSSPPY